MAKRGRKKKITNTDENGKVYSVGTSMGKYVDDCKECGLMIGEKDTHCPRCGLVIQLFSLTSPKYYCNILFYEMRYDNQWGVVMSLVGKSTTFLRMGA